MIQNEYKALHRTATPLRPIAAGELKRQAFTGQDQNFLAQIHGQARLRELL